MNAKQKSQSALRQAEFPYQSRFPVVRQVGVVVELIEMVVVQQMKRTKRHGAGHALSDIAENAKDAVLSRPFDDQVVRGLMNEHEQRMAAEGPNQVRAAQNP
jgi:hypothetical protein